MDRTQLTTLLCTCDGKGTAAKQTALTELFKHIDALEAMDEARGNFLMDRTGFFAATEQRLSSRIAVLEDQLNNTPPS